jgi:hypothetical protein
MRPIVVYDDTCGMCRNSVRWVRRLDWLRRLDDMGYSIAVERYPEIGRGQLGDGLRVRFPSGDVALGVACERTRQFLAYKGQMKRPSSQLSN